MEAKKVNRNIKCLLQDPDCKENCARCGWNPDEVERREIELAKNGLTTGEDGLQRLIIKRGE